MKWAFSQALPKSRAGADVGEPTGGGSVMNRMVWPSQENGVSGKPIKVQYRLSIGHFGDQARRRRKLIPVRLELVVFPAGAGLASHALDEFDLGQDQRGNLLDVRLGSFLGAC